MPEPLQQSSLARDIADHKARARRLREMIQDCERRGQDTSAERTALKVVLDVLARAETELHAKVESGRERQSAPGSGEAP